MERYKSREEWLQARKNYIGGSDAAAVIGQNPYKTNLDLWMEKTGQKDPEDISDQPYVKYGTLAEYHLRELFKLDYPDYEVVYEENNMWKNPKYPFAHASLDGWLKDPDGRIGILEIKTTNIMQSRQKEKWDHQIPNNYYCQVLHYLAVTGFEFAILKAQLKYDFSDTVFEQTRHYYIDRKDVEDDIRYLMQAEERFWQQVKNREQPALILPDL